VVAAHQVPSQKVAKAKGSRLSAPVPAPEARIFQPLEGEDNIRKSLKRLRAQLRANYLERDELIDVAITALIARTNAVLIGSPGTGKTRMVRDLVDRFSMSSFYYLLSATTQPDEIIGSLDLGELQANSVFKRDISGRVADVEVAIMDEVFKANSPCLNSLLEIMLDKTLTNGKTVVHAPLVSMFGMSNELPEDEELAPFWDRFAIRCVVPEVEVASQKALMMRKAGLIAQPELTESISDTDLALMQSQSQTLPMPESVIDAALQVVRELKDNAGIVVSTRKMVQLVSIVSAYAYVLGATIVDEEHLAILKYILWSEQDQIPAINKVIDDMIQASIIKYDNMLSGLKDSTRRWQNQSADSGGEFYKHAVKGSETRSAAMIVELQASLESATGRKAAKIKQTIQAVKDIRENVILPAFAEIDSAQADLDGY
jgi:MoxR-like ATPase